MADPTYADAITTQTSDEIRDDTLLPALVDQGVDVAGWPSTAPQRGLVEGDARALAYEQSVRAQMAKTKSPTDCIAAGSSWVDARLAWFSLDDGTGGKGRIKATKAQWDLPIKCTAAASPLTIDNTSKIVIQSTGGVYFESTQSSAVTLNSGNSYAATVRFTARAAGTSGNVGASTLTNGAIVSGPGGLSIGVTTPTQSVSARDQETDSEYVARGLAEWAKLGVAWTDPSFDFWIPLAGTQTITRWRVKDDNSYGPGSVGVVIANATGVPSDEEKAAVEALLGSREVRALGSGPLVVVKAAADALSVNIDLESDGTNPNLAANAQAAVLALLNAFPLGPATLDDSLVRGVALGGRYTSISVDIGGGKTKTITPNLPGFTGAVAINSIDLVAPHSVPTDDVLIPTVGVTTS